jgi:hypothetical protein
MPQIPNLPADLVHKVGVQMIPPPPDLLPSVNQMITTAIAQLPRGENGAFTAWIDTSEGVNGALVQRFGDHIDIVLYFGQTWGTPIRAGIAARVHW